MAISFLFNITMNFSNKKTLLFSIFASLSFLVSCSQLPANKDATTSAIAHINSTDWPSFGHDYSNQRFSAATQINRDNVSKLTTAWHYKSGVSASFQTTPIVVDGVMYLSLPYNHVVALDAKTGKQLWRYDHQLRKGWKLCCGPANRGVAVGYGKVFMGTVDARLVALDAHTGKVVWDIDAAEADVATEGQESLNKDDPNSHAKTTGGTGVGIAMAPIVYKGKVIIGITGVGYGLHIDNPREDAPRHLMRNQASASGNSTPFHRQVGKVFLPRRQKTVHHSIGISLMKRPIWPATPMPGAMAAARPGVRRRLIRSADYCISAPAILRLK